MAIVSGRHQGGRPISTPQVDARLVLEQQAHHGVLAHRRSHHEGGALQQRPCAAARACPRLARPRARPSAATRQPAAIRRGSRRRQPRVVATWRRWQVASRRAAGAVWQWWCSHWPQPSAVPCRRAGRAARCWRPPLAAPARTPGGPRKRPSSGRSPPQCSAGRRSPCARAAGALWSAAQPLQPP
eukprot:scaffold23492_cov65-Phaeocystis_antarctica.AAC.6